MSQLPPDWILLGYVTRAHGIQGALAYQVLNTQSDCLREGLEIALLTKKPPRYFKIQQILSGGRFLLEGLSDRTEAEKLAKTEIWVKRSDFREITSDEVYLADLIHFEAQDLKGQSLGIVTGFSDNRAQILVELNHKTLVPFIKPILIQIDEEKKRIVLDLPEGYDL